MHMIWSTPSCSLNLSIHIYTNAEKVDQKLQEHAEYETNRWNANERTAPPDDGDKNDILNKDCSYVWHHAWWLIKILANLGKITSQKVLSQSLYIKPGIHEVLLLAWTCINHTHDLEPRCHLVVGTQWYMSNQHLVGMCTERHLSSSLQEQLQWWPNPCQGEDPVTGSVLRCIPLQ